MDLLFCWKKSQPLWIGVQPFRNNDPIIEDGDLKSTNFYTKKNIIKKIDRTISRLSVMLK